MEGQIREEKGDDVSKILRRAYNSCNSDSDSYKLDLSSYSLSQLPHFSSLSTLLFLDLSSNHLKVLPESLFNDLPCLETLDLHSNLLPLLNESIRNLKKLKVLNISGNSLKGLPQGIGGCRALVELRADFNELERLPPGLGGCRKLEKLSLHSNKLTYISPSLLRELKGLKFLDLHFNKIATLPLEIGYLEHLEVLDLSLNSSDFGKGLPDTLGFLHRLLELDLSHNQIKVVPPSLGALDALQKLNLEGNPLSIPLLHVVEHSFYALKEYLAYRWQQTNRHYLDSPSNNSNTTNTSTSSSSIANYDEEEITSTGYMSPSYTGSYTGGYTRSWIADFLVWNCGGHRNTSLFGASSHHLLSKKDWISD